ncbi:hypothetical protein FLA_1766 [Filimonas lacunae]|nr:hypothetical protein FLA_1766 [Filimonas lacunae]
MVSLCALALLSMAAYKPSEQPRKRNLKILPQNISKDSLDRIMRGFNEALGVKCGFCHAPSKEGGRMDFSSDEKHEKETTRMMMTMTNEINKKYFMDDVAPEDSARFANKVTCNTCHRGNTIP